MKNIKFFSKIVLFSLALGVTSCAKTVYVPAAQTSPGSVLPNGEVALTTFCVDEAYDKPGEYMAGLGIVEGRPDRTKAIEDANRAAIADISSRYIGVIKNVIESYSKDVNVPSGQKIYESKLEGGIEAVGAAIIEKHAYVVCRQLARSATGGYVGYVAVHVEMSDLQKGLSEELEVRKVDYDADKLMKEHEAAVSKSMSQKRNLK